jgi:hypothetical protein
MTKVVCLLWSRLPWFSSETPGFSPFIRKNAYRLGDRLCQALGSVEQPHQQIRSSEYAVSGAQPTPAARSGRVASSRHPGRRSGPR